MVTNEHNQTDETNVDLSIPKASSAIATSLDVKEYFPTKSYFDSSMIKSITASMPKVKLDVNDEYIASMSFLSDVVRDLSESVTLN